MKDSTIRELRTELMVKSKKIETLKFQIKKMEEDLLEITTAYTKIISTQKKISTKALREKVDMKVNKYQESLVAKLEKLQQNQIADMPGIKKLDLSKIKGDINVSSK